MINKSAVHETGISNCSNVGKDISMCIYTPTWLYIKQHTITKLKYFGKTIQDPHIYQGSGVYWTNHLKKHGYAVTTTWCQLFDNEQSLIEYALNFSKSNNIVESKEWANLMLENGKTGGTIQITDKGRQKISDSKKGKARPQNVVDALSKPKTAAHKKNIGIANRQEWVVTDVSTNVGVTVDSLKDWCNGKSFNYQMVLRFAHKNSPYKGFAVQSKLNIRNMETV